MEFTLKHKPRRNITCVSQQDALSAILHAVMIKTLLKHGGFRNIFTFGDLKIHGFHLRRQNFLNVHGKVGEDADAILILKWARETNASKY